MDCDSHDDDNQNESIASSDEILNTSILDQLNDKKPVRRPLATSHQLDQVRK